MRKAFKNEDILHAFIILTGGGLFVIGGWIALLSIVSALSFFLMIRRNLDTFSQMRPWGGYANRVTITRLSLLLALGFLYIYMSNLQIAIYAFVLLCMDGLDGFLARKYKHQSDFGGKLDGETDAYFVLFIACIDIHLGLMGYWVLWAGLLRYLFVLICYLWWGKIEPEPPSFFRKTIAVIIMVSLLTPMILPSSFATPLVIAATLAVTYSFIKSFVFQWKSNRNRYSGFDKTTNL